MVVLLFGIVNVEKSTFSYSSVPLATGAVAQPSNTYWNGSEQVSAHGSISSTDVPAKPEIVLVSPQSLKVRVYCGQSTTACTSIIWSSAS